MTRFFSMRTQQGRPLTEPAQNIVDPGITNLPPRPVGRTTARAPRTSDDVGLELRNRFAILDSHLGNAVSWYRRIDVVAGKPAMCSAQRFDRMERPSRLVTATPGTECQRITQEREPNCSRRLFARKYRDFGIRASSLRRNQTRHRVSFGAGRYPCPAQINQTPPFQTPSIFY